MYPDYKQQAITCLADMFAGIATRQFNNPMFGESGLVSFDNKAVDLTFSTRDVINIAKLVRDLPLPTDPKSAEWIKNQRAAVRELAQKAEQHENDDPLHLLHTMMNLYFVCKGTDTGWLNAKMDEHGMTVFLTEEFSGAYLLKESERVSVLYNDKYEDYKIMEVALYYSENENEWQLTFKAIHLKSGKEVILKNEQVSPNDKKVIADWMIFQARIDIHRTTPLEQQENGEWTAPRKNVREVDGVQVLTAINELTDCNILTVEAGTNGRQGGDTGHGGRTYLRITNDASTDLNCRTAVGRHEKDANGQYHYCLDTTDHGHVDQIEIMLGGDSELDTFIDALEFAADVLRKQRDGQMTTEIPDKQKK